MKWWMGVLVLFLMGIGGNCVVATEGVLYNERIATKTVDAFSRQKTQLSQGVYDPISNKTFVVYPSGIDTRFNISGNRLPNSAVSPYIRAYDHSTHLWGPEVQIAISPSPPDSHNYPQIIIDRNGYLHVFETFHAGHDVLHAVSTNPRDESTWRVGYISNPSTLKATYGAAVKSKSGDIYLLYRSTEEMSPYYEPEYYLKSVDNGLTFTKQKLIDPEKLTLEANDMWRTIYTKSINYQPELNRVNITFELKYNHNDYFENLYYVYLDLGTDKLYSAGGRDLGKTVTRTVFDNVNGACPECKFFAYGTKMSVSDYGASILLSVTDENNRPQVFYNFYDGLSPKTAKARMKQASWNGSGWTDKDLNELGDIVFAQTMEYKSSNDIDMYLRKYDPNHIPDPHPAYIYHFDGVRWTQGYNIYNTLFPSGSGAGWPTLVSDYNPEIRLTFLNSIPQNYYWGDPQPLGSYYVVGENDFGQSSVCGNTGVKRVVGGGNPYFIYPKNQPCDEYRVGSRNYSQAEMVSKLMAVEPNKQYIVEYLVKTIGVVKEGSVASTNVGTVLVGEYGVNAKESDGLEVNRVAGGIVNGVTETVGVTDWVGKKYTLTTGGNTKFIRLRMLNTETGKVKGEVYFKSLSIQPLTCIVESASLGNVLTTMDSFKLNWLNGNGEAVYLSVSNSNEMMATGGLKNINIVNELVTGKNSYERLKVSPGTYYWQLVSDGCPDKQRKFSPVGMFVIHALGDSNGDGVVNMIDFSVWKDEYIMGDVQTLVTKRADFNQDSKVDMIDFSIWKSEYLKTL